MDDDAARGELLHEVLAASLSLPAFRPWTRIKDRAASRGNPGNSLVLEDLDRLQYEGAGKGSHMRIQLFRVSRRDEALATYDRIIAKGGDYLTQNLKRCNHRMAVAQAARLQANGVDPAKALSVSMGTLAAWRAHATRGTYDKQAKEKS